MTKKDQPEHGNNNICWTENNLLFLKRLDFILFPFILNFPTIFVFKANEEANKCCLTIKYEERSVCCLVKQWSVPFKIILILSLLSGRNLILKLIVTDVSKQRSSSSSKKLKKTQIRQREEKKCLLREANKKLVPTGHRARIFLLCLLAFC